MGWYITCKYCGKEEKWGPPPCGCVDRAMKRLSDKRKEAKILESTIVVNEYDTNLIEKLLLPNGEIFYLSICIHNGWPEQGRYGQAINEIDPRDYEAALISDIDPKQPLQQIRFIHSE